MNLWQRFKTLWKKPEPERFTNVAPPGVRLRGDYGSVQDWMTYFGSYLRATKKRRDGV